MDFKHISVLLEECIDAIQISKKLVFMWIVLLGGAGHSSEILKSFHR